MLKILSILNNGPGCQHYTLHLNIKGAAEKQTVYLPDMEKLFTEFSGGSIGALALAWVKWQLDHGTSAANLLDRDIAPIVGVEVEAKTMGVMEKIGNLFKRGEKLPKLDRVNPLGLR